MTAATRTIITSAIRADLTISPSAKAKLLRFIANPSAEPEMRLFTEKQAALVLGVSIPTIARMKRDGELKTRKVRKTKRITAESLYAYTK
ncbi:MAG: helix-turn-helix domain-containing protein [Kiritimatiellae bacterium]|nr:helix-turn-helix domain-containing protein [Kiritimatiellia bacterium]